MDEFEKKLKQILYREDCPDTTLLADYIVENLSREQQTKINLHVGRCTHCAGELATARKLIVDTESDSQSFKDKLKEISDSARIFFAKLVHTQENAQPQFALRDTETRGEVYEIDGIEIDLNWLQQNDGQFVITGGFDVDDLPSTVEAQLEFLGTDVLKQVVNLAMDNGELVFRFGPVPPGLYVATFITPNNRIIVPAFQVA